MPRDLSGNYSLPSGSPATAGTRILSSRWNAFINDVSDTFNEAVFEDSLLDVAVIREASTLTVLLADNTLTYTSGLVGTVVSGDVIRARKENYSFTVASSAASDHHVTTAGGVKLYVQPDASGYSVAAFGALGGAADDTAALQKALDSGAKRINLLGSTWRYTALSIPSDIVIENGSLLKTTNAGTTGITIARTARPTFKKVSFLGSGSDLSYVASERLVSQEGTNASTRGAGAVFIDCKFSGCSQYGMYFKWTDDIYVEFCRFDSIAYAGAAFLSCNRGRFVGNRIDVLNAVGTASNAYGATWTHDSTNYNLDANAGTQQAANPFCSDWYVAGNTVLGPKIWQAIDTHGCYNFTIINNKTFAAAAGISVTASSGGAANYAGWKNVVSGNIIDTRLEDGTSASVSGTYGITLTGGSTANHNSVICTGNIIHGYGNAVGGVGIYCLTYAKNVIISQNIIRDWDRAGVNVGTGSGNVTVTDNIFTEMRANTSATCIDFTSAFTGRAVVGGNQCEDGTFDPSIGLQVANASARVLVNANNFDNCATPYSITAGSAHGPGFPGTINVSSTSGAYTLDAALSRLAPAVPLTVLFSSLSGAITSVTINNAVSGTRLRFINLDATNSVTFTRAAAALGGSANWVGDRYDSLDIQLVTATWIEQCRSANG